MRYPYFRAVGSRGLKMASHPCTAIRIVEGRASGGLGRRVTGAAMPSQDQCSEHFFRPAIPAPCSKTLGNGTGWSMAAVEDLMWQRKGPIEGMARTGDVLVRRVVGTGPFASQPRETALSPIRCSSMDVVSKGRVPESLEISGHAIRAIGCGLLGSGQGVLSASDSLDPRDPAETHQLPIGESARSLSSRLWWPNRAVQSR